MAESAPRGWGQEFGREGRKLKLGFKCKKKQVQCFLYYLPPLQLFIFCIFNM